MDKNNPPRDGSNNTLSYNAQIYTLESPPSINESSFIIEANFLRHIKFGEIPNLDKYLIRLICHDWSNLLAHNPRIEFIGRLNTNLLSKIDWPYVKQSAENKKEQLDSIIMDFIIGIEREFKLGNNLYEYYQNFLKLLKHKNIQY